MAIKNYPLIQLKFYPEKKRKININIINSLSFDLKRKIKEDLKRVTKKNHFVRLA